MFDKLLDLLTIRDEPSKKYDINVFELFESMFTYLVTFIACGLAGAVDAILLYLNTLDGTKFVDNQTIHAICVFVVVPAITSMLKLAKDFLTEDKDGDKIPDFVQTKKEKQI